MTGTLLRPPFDPELAALLAAFEEHGRPELTEAMLPRMRQLEITEAELGERLRERGLECRSLTVPGHRGDPNRLSVIQPAGRGHGRTTRSESGKKRPTVRDTRSRFIAFRGVGSC